MEVLQRSPIHLDSFHETIEKPSQYDFIRRLQSIPENFDNFFSITENMYLNAYSIKDEEDKMKIKKIGFKKFPTYLYDVCPIPKIEMNIEANEEITTCLAVSSKAAPLNLYEFRPNTQKQNFRCVGEINIIKPNSEDYIGILEMKYSTELHGLLTVGRNTLMVYDINTSKYFYKSKLFGKTEIVSCLSIPQKNPSSIVAVGNYDNHVKLISMNSDEVISEFKSHVGGVTCVKFSQYNPAHIFSGARKDNLVYLWDMRKPDSFVNYFERRSFTNQRLTFDISPDNILFLGNDDGSVAGYNVNDGSLKYYWQVDSDIITDVHLIKKSNQKYNYVLTACGDRKFEIWGDNTETDSDDENNGVYAKEVKNKKNPITLWKHEVSELSEPLVEQPLQNMEPIVTTPKQETIKEVPKNDLAQETPIEHQASESTIF